jgi:hypothetical protein
VTEAFERDFWRVGSVTAARVDGEPGPQAIATRDGVVAVLGHTTGSHLGFPDDEEAKLSLIWTSTIARGTLTTWKLVADTPGHRQRYGLVG